MSVRRARLHLLVTAALLAAACAAPAARPAASPTPLDTVAARSAAPTLEPAPSASSSPRPAVATLVPVQRPIRYIAIGASDTVGSGATDPARRSWPALIAAKMPAGSSYQNLGVGGSTVARALAEQLPRAVPAADVVTVWLAVNDLNAQVSAAAYAATLDQLLVGLTGAGHRHIFVGNVPDLTSVPRYAAVDQTLLRKTIKDYNEAIALITGAHPQVVLVDLHRGSAQLVSGGTVSADGFHPNDAGYALIAERFLAEMRGRSVPLAR